MTENRKVKDFYAIIIMGACNLQCAYCGNVPFSLKEEETVHSLEQIFEDIEKDRSVLRVECRGEITLYQSIIDYLDKKAREGYTIEILSNGILLDRVLQSDSPIHVVISLDGHTAKMNRMRRLTQKQVNGILENIFNYSCEVQCVYYKQKLTELSAFIQFLEQKHFKEALHIFPCSENGKIISYLDFRKLPPASFLPDQNYFDRWSNIYKTGKRNFICDFYKNGFTYYVYNNQKYMVKCDCVPESVNWIQPYENGSRDISYHKCFGCINHYEYNNRRKIMQYK